MACFKASQPPFGQQNLYFQELSQFAATLDIHIIFIPYLNGVVPKTAWIYQQKWLSIAFKAFPLIIYDRVILNTPKKRKEYYHYLETLQSKEICLYNGPGIQTLADDKLRSSAFCQQHNLPVLECLPISELFPVLKQASANQQAQSIFIKPRLGYGGQNITYLCLHGSKLSLESYHTGEKKEIPFNELEFSQIIKNFPSDEYIISPETPSCALSSEYILEQKSTNCCPSSSHSPNSHSSNHPRSNRHFDLRVLLQKRSPASSLEITGIAARVGLPGSKISNISQHQIDKGTPALAYEQIFAYLQKQHIDFDPQQTLDKITNLCFKTSQQLETHYEVMELGLDILLDYQFNPFLIEINAKPARWSFFLIGQDRQIKLSLQHKYQSIREKSIQYPILYGMNLVSDKQPQ